MTLKTDHAPYLRRGESSSLVSADILIALIPLCIFSSVYYGLRPVLIVLTGILTAVICETVCCLMMKRKPTVLDGNAAVIGGLIGALMPPLLRIGCPLLRRLLPFWWPKCPLAAAGGICSIRRRRYSGSDPVLYVHHVPLSRSRAGQSIPSSGFRGRDRNGKLSRRPAEQRRADPVFLEHPAVRRFPRPHRGHRHCGAGGLCDIPVFPPCCLSPDHPVLSDDMRAQRYCLPRVSGEWYTSVMLELCTGYLLFCGIFLLTDPATAPRHWMARIVYGAAAGALVMTMRHFGRFEEGACFAVLLVNAFAPCWTGSAGGCSICAVCTSARTDSSLYVSLRRDTPLPRIERLIAL